MNSRVGVQQTSPFVRTKTAFRPSDHFEGKLASASASDDQIRDHAYQLYELRGRGEGRALDDWLSAERQLNLRARKNRANKVIF